MMFSKCKLSDKIKKYIKIKQCSDKLATEVWQTIAVGLTVKEKIQLSQVNTFFHDQVIFGEHSIVFAWRDGVNDIHSVPHQMYKNKEFISLLPEHVKKLLETLSCIQYLFATGRYFYMSFFMYNKYI